MSKCRALVTIQVEGASDPEVAARATQEYVARLLAFLKGADRRCPMCSAEVERVFLKPGTRWLVTAPCNHELCRAPKFPIAWRESNLPTKGA